MRSDLHNSRNENMTPKPMTHNSKLQNFCGQKWVRLVGELTSEMIGDHDLIGLDLCRK